MDKLSLLLLQARQRAAMPDPEVRRALREENGLSQRGLAACVRVSAAAISRWEAGLRSPRGKAGDRYASLLARLAAERNA